MGTHDADLMRRWRQGDGAAFEALVVRWQQPVARFLYRVTGRADRVADLCQDVFLRVYHAASRYREEGAFPAWLYRIALNVARDSARKSRRDPKPLGVGEPSCPSARTDEAAARRELEGRLALAVAELPEPLRVVLALRHDEGLSFEEIARLTGTPASTLKSRFAVALTRLRTRLRELGIGPEETTP